MSSCQTENHLQLVGFMPMDHDFKELLKSSFSLNKIIWIKERFMIVQSPIWSNAIPSLSFNHFGTFHSPSRKAKWFCGFKRRPQSHQLNVLKIIVTTVSLWDFENPTLLIWISLEFDPPPVISIMMVSGLPKRTSIHLQSFTAWICNKCWLWLL